jgi:hypothetical protein
MSSALAKTGVQITSIREVFDLAEQFSRARGFVPDQFIGQPQALAAAMLMGIELGMGPMEALRSIHVIKGKPSMSAEVMLARALRAGIKCVWTRTDDACATLEITRDGVKRAPFSFTMEDAKRAGLAGSDNWKKYPSAMLRARCTSAAMRAHCPDVLGSSVYTPEELDASVKLDAQGDIIDTTEVHEMPREAAREAPRLEAPKQKRLTECADREELGEWCKTQRNVSADLRPRLRLGIVKHCADLGISAEETTIFLDAAGFETDRNADNRDAAEDAIRDEQEGDGPH